MINYSLIINWMKLSASNNISMIFQETVEERNWKFPQFKILLSLTCLHSNTLKFYSLLLNFVKFTIQYGNYEEIPSRKENYGESTYVLRHLTKYSWWIRQLSSARIILHLWFKLVPAIGYLANSGQLWFLSRTIIDEQRVPKTEKKIDQWECPFTKMGSVAVYPQSLRACRKKRTSPDCLKIRRNCINTLDFSISIDILILQ